jgi:hypothetical protein
MSAVAAGPNSTVWVSRALKALLVPVLLFYGAWFCFEFCRYGVCSSIHALAILQLALYTCWCNRKEAHMPRPDPCTVYDCAGMTCC